MAQTDTRPGFRLPWSSDRADAETADPTAETEATATDATTEAAPEATTTTDTEATVDTDAAPVSDDAPASIVGTAEVETTAQAGVESVEASTTEPTDGVDWSMSAATSEPEPEPVVTAPEPKPVAAKKPNKLMADLSKAMQATAEAARAETMERFAADAKTATERVHATAAEESAELRRVADEDVAGIRDWSKAEIARIREETEHRISGRKSDLETQLEQHAGTIEGRIERVNAFVAAFEAEMAAFFERLSAEEDPARLAAMAEQLPEAPSLDLAELDAAVLIGTSSAPAPVVEPVVEAITETIEPESATSATEGSVDVDASAESSESATSVEAEAVTDVTATNESPDATAETSSEPVVSEPAVAETADPRLEALGLGGSDDFAAAEAEAAFAADAAAEGEPSAADVEEIPVIADEVLAARIAGLVPEENSSSNPLVTTKVIVSGLVSVASIAGFKRHLSRLQGVTTVGVSSGPDGEFVFSVHHLPTVDLAAGITSLPGFDTRITGQDDGSVTVTARDPESHD